MKTNDEVQKIINGEKIDPAPWPLCKTFEETIIFFIKNKLTKTEEFQAMLKYYGRQRLEQIWKKHVEEKKSDIQT